MSDKTLCQGCRDDYYNHGENSTTGECWLLKSAKKVKRVRVGTWQNPPYRWRPETTYSCWAGKGQHMIERDDPRVVDDTDEAVEKWENKHGPKQTS